MSAESLFTFANTYAIMGWLLLAAAPRWRWTHRLVPLAFALPLSGLYLYLVVTTFGKSPGSFNTLAGVVTLFQNPTLALGGWIHYLVFDLFVGAWEVRDAQRLGISHLLVLPALFLTLMFGPIGLLLYWLLRTGIRKRPDFVEQA